MKDVEIIKARNVLSSRARTNLAKRLRVAAYCRVSTDSEDQLNSYKSQVQHYTDLIKSKSEWDLAGIYADEAITGTQVTKREDFQRLINDCMNGDVDMIITKSISRFARNTLDTLKYVRMLKEKGIAVFFEEENINTLTMDGELLLVILSSVAQQEVENISANVKKGLKMKMQRGELVGFQGCLGYDYHPEDKSISINEEEAEIVRYIFRRYIEGAGGSVIAQELENLGYKTKRGSTRWAETTVIGIIKNEKYKGDILMGKTFTLDPISKRRLDNFGEEDQFYIRDHHEAIISEEMFEKAQEILECRSKTFKLTKERQSNKYLFSTLIKCKECGWSFRRTVRTYKNTYIRWVCSGHNGRGADSCPNAQTVDEEELIEVLSEYFSELLKAKKNVIRHVTGEFQRVYKAKDENLNYEKELNAQLHKLQKMRQKYMDMYTDDLITREELNEKIGGTKQEIERLENELKMVAYHLTKGEQLEIILNRTFKEIEDISDVHQMTNAQLKRIIQKIEVDKDGNVDIYLRIFGDLGLDETVLISDNQT